MNVFQRAFKRISPDVRPVWCSTGRSLDAMLFDKETFLGLNRLCKWLTFIRRITGTSYVVMGGSFTRLEKWRFALSCKCFRVETKGIDLNKRITERQLFILLEIFVLLLHERTIPYVVGSYLSNDSQLHANYINRLIGALWHIIENRLTIVAIVLTEEFNYVFYLFEG